MNIVVALFLVTNCVLLCEGSTKVPIGGLFNMYSLQSSKDVYNKVNTSSVYYGRVIDTDVSVDTYTTSLHVCQHTTTVNEELNKNQTISAIIDMKPTYGQCDITCMLCNKLNISYLSVDFQIPDTISDYPFTFYYYPPAELVSKAFAALIKNLNWDKFTIFYEDDYSFIRLQEVINTWPYSGTHTHDPILFRKLDPDGDNREIFKHVFKVERMSYHVLDCEVQNIRKYIEEIVQVENSTQYQSFILTNLDSYLENLQDIRNFEANMSTLHIAKADDNRWGDIGMDSLDYPLNTALVSDALSHLEKSIRKLLDDYKSYRIPLEDAPPICYSSWNPEEKQWASGSALRQALLETTVKGFTGNIQFDEEGRRTNFVLYYSKLNHDSQFENVGHWDSNKDVVINDREVADRSSSAFKSNTDRKIQIYSRLGKPHFDLNPNGTIPYKGFAVDLVEAIFQHINSKKKQDYKYEFKRVKGDAYGNPIEGTKKWNGLIGEVMSHNADMAICDISITSERNSVVDFSTPFMSLGISMLFKEDEPEPPDMFSFIQPFSLDVWLYLVTTYIIVSFVLLICARMSQDDWVNPHPCNQNPEDLENIWSLYNCMWLTMGAIMTQGCDILPRAMGSRWITGMWWFFALIVSASYTANMSTFLSNSRRDNEIKSVQDLAQQTSVMYGAVENASTYKFFKYSNETIYQKLWSVMSSAKPSVFTSSNEEGRDRVLRSKGKYAFFMESTSIEYFTKRNCKLKMVGGKLDSKEYGIALPKNSQLKSMIDDAILSLQESGQLEIIRKKWWEEEDNEAHCEPEEEADSGSLQMDNTAGIFLVLGFGGILGLIVAIIDFMLHARKISVREKVRFKDALLSEWRASLDPRVLHKPAAPPRSAPPSESPAPVRERSQSRAVSVLRAATSFINFDEIY